MNNIEQATSLQYLNAHGKRKQQLYYEGGLFNEHREKNGVKYWVCVGRPDCKASLSTCNEVVTKAPQVPHFGHAHIPLEDYECRVALDLIKHRVLNEVHVYASLIYAEERSRLIQRGISVDAVAAYLKPYEAYKVRRI